MQVFSRVVILSLAGMALAAPAPSPLDLDSPTLVVRQEDSETVRTIEVLTKMEETLGELNWVTTPSDGQLLTVPTAEWEGYVDIVKAEHETQRNQERALQKRTIRVSGGIDGRWAEYGCYTTGDVMPSSGARQFNIDVDLACGDFSYTLQSQVQVRTGSYVGTTGVRWVLKFENWGKLSYSWSKAKCVDALNKALDLCRDSSGSTQGGWLDVYTAPQQNTQTRGDKALSFTVDPRT